MWTPLNSLKAIVPFNFQCNGVDPKQCKTCPNTFLLHCIFKSSGFSEARHLCRHRTIKTLLSCNTVLFFSAFSFRNSSPWTPPKESHQSRRCRTRTSWRTHYQPLSEPFLCLDSAKEKQAHSDLLLLVWGICSLCFNPPSCFLTCVFGEGLCFGWSIGIRVVQYVDAETFKSLILCDCL